MSWFVLIISGVFEAVWATALGRSEGFTRLWPSVVFCVAVVMSMGGLSWAMRDLPTGTAYAVWVAIGAVGTVVWAMATGSEPASALKVLFLVLIIGGVVGLKVVS
jgi:quaternary ammonium compound-resistance protein SugE